MGTPPAHPLAVPWAEETLMGSTQLSKASQEHPHGQGRAGHGLELLGHWGLSFPENLGKKDLGKKGLRKKKFLFL